MQRVFPDILFNGNKVTFLRAGKNGRLHLLTNETSAKGADQREAEHFTRSAPPCRATA
ncbi:MAG: hypothetical protein ACRC2T_07740 [Thermoguttaceae bacterium]